MMMMMMSVDLLFATGVTDEEGAFLLSMVYSVFVCLFRY
jgi:hypothetical protein